MFSSETVKRVFRTKARYRYDVITPETDFFNCRIKNKITYIWSKQLNSRVLGFNLDYTKRPKK